MQPLCLLPPLVILICLVARERSGIKGKWGPDDTKQLLNGADVVFADVTDPASLTNVLKDRKVDVIVSCLASRTGGRKVSIVEISLPGSSQVYGEIAHYLLEWNHDFTH